MRQLLTRDEAIKAVGEAAVEAVEAENCECDNTLRPESERHWSRWISAVGLKDGGWLKLYFDVPSEVIDAAGEDLGNVDWAKYEEGYEVCN